MIGMLTGKIVIKTSGSIILSVNNVGYKILLPTTLFQKALLGEEKTYFTYTYVREDALELFGFNEGEDLVLFEKLLSVSGIGPKTALNVFSVGERSEILGAIGRGDTAFFKSVPRLGTKNAQKIILELKGKLDFGSGEEVSEENSEVVDALVGFGFKKPEVMSILDKVEEGSVEEKIKQALKLLGR